VTNTKDESRKRRKDEDENRRKTKTDEGRKQKKDESRKVKTDERRSRGPSVVEERKTNEDEITITEKHRVSLIAHHCPFSSHSISPYLLVELIN
jgi:hypothetical protein